MKRVLGLDIGGANLKWARTDGAAQTLPFELWKQPAKLPAALAELVAGTPRFDEVAVTMTGELCDCFETRREGVDAILDAVVKTFQPLPQWIWCNDGQWLATSAARQAPYRVASANWLALATLAGRFMNAGPGLLIDIGSTTTDIIPCLDGKPVPQGRTDSDRLLTDELVYRGVRRTPILWSTSDRLAAELFATTLDAFLVLGKMPEDAADRGTADGRPTTKHFAHGRLARMLGGDGETCPAHATMRLAQSVIGGLTAEIGSAIKRVAGRLPACPTPWLSPARASFSP